MRDLKLEEIGQVYGAGSWGSCDNDRGHGSKGSKGSKDFHNGSKGSKGSKDFHNGSKGSKC